MLHGRIDGTTGLAPRYQAGSTPLHRAVHARQSALLSELLEADSASLAVNVHDDHTGATPLHTACTNGDVAAAEALLRAGANPEALDRQGDAPLSLLRDEAARLRLQAGKFGKGTPPAIKTRAVGAGAQKKKKKKKKKKTQKTKKTEAKEQD